MVITKTIMIHGEVSIILAGTEVAGAEVAGTEVEVAKIWLERSNWR
jgi:hypothetical protein